MAMHPSNGSSHRGVNGWRDARFVRERASVGNLQRHSIAEGGEESWAQITRSQQPR